MQNELIVNELIVRAAEIVGSKAALAKRLGVKPPTVHQWISCERPVPARRCRDIETATAGEITAAQLRPDVFPPAEPVTKPEAA
jgi:DNA-binding transcriptional regulator YdaS (Cro superfamily)